MGPHLWKVQMLGLYGRSHASVKMSAERDDAQGRLAPPRNPPERTAVLQPAQAGIANQLL